MDRFPEFLRPSRCSSGPGDGLDGMNRIGLPKFLILRAGNGCLGGVRVVMVLLLTQFPSNEKTTFRI